MPGPMAGHRNTPAHRSGNHDGCKPTGKTKRDKDSGKWNRRLVNRHADPIRERGGKQFSKN